MTAGSDAPVRLWDGAVRLVHWGIALLFAASWYTHRDHLEWHRYAGYGLLSLVLFRLYWGVFGSETARFRQFVRGPRTVARYARALLRGPRQAGPPGHSPVGALSVVLLLGLLLAQCAIGLFVTDVDGLESGPLSHHVSFETGRALASWHGRLFTPLQTSVALHVAAVLFYLLVRRDNLVGPMIHGRKRLAEGAPPLHFARWWHAATAFSIIAAAIWLSLGRG